MENNSDSFPVNPLVKQLLDAGERVLVLDGYIGPTEGERVRLYRDLSLITYVEIVKKDVLRVENVPDAAGGLARLYVRVSAELRLVQAVAFTGSDVLSAAELRGKSGGCGETARTGSSGLVDPPDNCYGQCEIFWRLCIDQHFGDAWCALAYAGCVSTCGIIDTLPIGPARGW